MEVRLDVADAFALDNRAFTVVGNPRKAQVLLVSESNRYLTDTLKTPTLTEVADVETITPDEAKADDRRRLVQAGRYDLVIYDRVRPETLPEANTLFFGAFPPGTVFNAPRSVEHPVILDWDLAHPLMQYVRDLGLVRIAKASVVELPLGAVP